MSRLAVLFKIDDQELEDLKKQKKMICMNIC